jgi:hypothetical protein
LIRAESDSVDSGSCFVVKIVEKVDSEVLEVYEWGEPWRWRRRYLEPNAVG